MIISSRVEASGCPCPRPDTSRLSGHTRAQQEPPWAGHVEAASGKHRSLPAGVWAGDGAPGPRLLRVCADTYACPSRELQEKHGMKAQDPASIPHHGQEDPRAQSQEKPQSIARYARNPVNLAHKKPLISRQCRKQPPEGLNLP